MDIVSDEVASESRGTRGRGAPKRKAQDIPDDSFQSTPTFSVFSSFERSLTAKYDRHEALVKISRDITVQSKRVIFLLQRYQHRGNNEAMIKEAEDKIPQISGLFLKVMETLAGEPQHKYFRAVSPGVQEFVEAVSFYWALVHRQVLTPEDLAPYLTFPNISFVVAPTDFMAGIADLTGELMRCCINHAGDAEASTHFCNMIREIYTGMSGIPAEQLGRETSEKLKAMKSSLEKVEDACYTACIRKAEFPNISINLDSFAAPDEAPVEE